MLDQLKLFRELVWDFYRLHGRDLPWRNNPTPYEVFVSEVMLQQTQVSRVLVKYPAWMRRFPGFETLADAAVSEVLKEWQGMGYNRRALWLRNAAQMVMNDFDGTLPHDPAVLVKLPGVGPHTAGSMAAFAYNEPTVFIETNIRRVFIYHFEELIGGLAVSDLSGATAEVTHRAGERDPSLQGAQYHDQRRLTVSNLPLPLRSDQDPISDVQLRPLVEAALDREHPREWYYALMDYGADLAKRVPNPNRRSKHYNVQSKFEGSLRQLRGEVLRQLLAGPKTAGELGIDDERLPLVLADLVKEGFIHRSGDMYRVGHM